MTIYNVRQSVVALVDADSPDDAIGKYRAALEKAGFNPFDDIIAVATTDAFESEILTSVPEIGADGIVR